MGRFKIKNYRNSGKMVGQTFNPSGVSNPDPAIVSMMLEAGKSAWEALPEGRLPFKEAYDRYPHARRFMQFIGFNTREYIGQGIPEPELAGAQAAVRAVWPRVKVEHMADGARLALRGAGRVQYLPASDERAAWLAAAEMAGQRVRQLELAA